MMRQIDKIARSKNKKLNQEANSKINILWMRSTVLEGK